MSKKLTYHGPVTSYSFSCKNCMDEINVGPEKLNKTIKYCPWCDIKINEKLIPVYDVKRLLKIANS